MSVDQVSIFLALLALLALAVGAVALAACFASGLRERLADFGTLLLPLALAVATVAMAGSLYYSEVAGYPPCELCWYQRIGMYPLVPVLAVGLWHRGRAAGWYALPLAVAGLGVSAYHYQLQLSGGQNSSCDPSAPCSFQWVDALGFASIPFMAGCGFAAIAGLALLSIRSDHETV